MEVTLNSDTQTALIADWTETDWVDQAPSVPSAYTMIFQPSVDETSLAATIPNRTVSYVSQTIYQSYPFGNGYVSMPSTLVTQTMLPVANAS